jgi:chromosome segregation ATPase
MSKKAELFEIARGNTARAREAEITGLKAIHEVLLEQRARLTEDAGLLKKSIGTQGCIIEGLQKDLETERKLKAAEVTDLKAAYASLREELDLSDKEQLKLENELRRTREKYSKMQTRLDNLDALMARRTTALCALIELPDPKWVPKPEDMEP